jgi:hypothetical protein
MKDEVKSCNIKNAMDDCRDSFAGCIWWLSKNRINAERSV